MLNLRKFAVVAVALSVAASVAFAGCGKSGGESTQTVTTQKETTKQVEAPKQVNLKWVLGGPGKQQDSDKVWEEFNKKLQEKLPNTTVEFDVIPFSEYGEKWKLMAASGDEIDLAWTGWMIGYVDEVGKGAYIALDDLIDKYAPDIKKEIPGWILDLARVNGKIYSMPCYQQMTDYRFAFQTPKDLSDKYWDLKATQKVWDSHETFLKEDFDLVEPYLKNLKDNNLLGKGINPSMSTNLKGYYHVFSDYQIKFSDKEYKVQHYLQTPEAKAYVSTLADWYKKGYIRKDILTDKTDYKGKKDGYVLWGDQYYFGIEAAVSKQFGMQIAVTPVIPYYSISALQSNTSTAITRTSKNPDRAMQLMDLMNTKKGTDMYNLLAYGLEGEHYKKVSTDRIETIDYTGSPEAKSKYGIQAWVLGNTFNAWDTQTTAEGYKNSVIEMHEKAKVAPTVGFKLNIEPIKNELSQYQAVRKEFWPALTSGTLPNWEEIYNQMIEKMKTAGQEKIQLEVQKQLDEFLKAKGLK